MRFKHIPKGNWIMNRLLILFAIILTGLTLLGCSTAAKEITTRSQSE